MSKNISLRKVLKSIIDKNLYRGIFFAYIVVPSIFALIIQFLFSFWRNLHLFIIYFIIYCCLIVVLGLRAKNMPAFHPMGFLSAVLLLTTSAFSKMLALIILIDPTYANPAGFYVILILSEPALLLALISIIVYAQRTSLRKSVGLHDKFFDKEKARWENELKEFPNLDNILNSVSGGRFIKDLFDKGLFNLTILWSCSVMGETIDAIATGIISKNPEKEKLFKKENCHKQRYYPTQLKNLGYKLYPRENQFNLHTLWGVRRKIAHTPYMPTYNETRGALEILVSFTKEIPTILLNWKSQNFNPNLPLTALKEVKESNKKQ